MDASSFPLYRKDGLVKPPPGHGVPCYQSWKFITVVALLALGSLAVGIMTLLSSHYPALSGLKVLGFAGSVSFISASGLLFVIALLGFCSECAEEEPVPKDVLQPPRAPVDPENALPPPEAAPEPKEPTHETVQIPGVSSFLLKYYERLFHSQFYTAVQSVLLQRTSHEHAPYISSMESIAFPHEHFLGKSWGTTIPIDPSWPKPDFNKLARLFVMSDQEILNLSCEEIVSLDPYELAMIHTRLYVIDYKEKAPTEYQSVYNPKGSLGDLRSLSVTSMNLKAIPAKLLSMLRSQQIEMILKTCVLDSECVNLLFPPRESRNVAQDSIQLRRIRNLNSLSNEAIKQQLPLLMPHLREMYVVKFQSPDFPWEQFILIPHAAHHLFSLEKDAVWRARDILRSINVRVIKQLAPILSGQHLRELNYNQLSSKEFPVDELLNSPEKRAQFFDMSTPDKMQETITILHMIDPQVIRRLAPVLSGKHLRLLSYQQYASLDFPAEELLKEAAKAADFFDTSGAGKEESLKEILRQMDPQVIQKLAPLLSGLHLRVLSKTQLASPLFPVDILVGDQTKLEAFFRSESYDVHDFRSKYIFETLHTSAREKLIPVLPAPVKKTLNIQQP